MPSPSTLLAFAAAAFALIVVPGPSVLFVVGRGVALGRRAALLSVLGNAAGQACQVIAVAVGLGAVVASSAAMFTTLKLAGAAYLVFLGIQAVRHRRDVAAALGFPAVALGSRRLLAEGFIVGLSNPKSIVFFAAILPQFIDGGGPAGLQMLVLGLVFLVIALASDSVWALAAGGARDALAARPQRLERLGLVGGLVMVGLGVRLAMAGRPD